MIREGSYLDMLREFGGITIHPVNKEEPMNTVKMTLAAGNNKFTKIVEMTNIMVRNCEEGKTLSILDRDMDITTFTLDSSPKWNMHILFAYNHNQTDISLEEYDALRDDGWVRVTGE